MRLVELEVRDIRSYRHASISLGAGITLLSGDIGSGKSSILHAIEFALFGLARGELSGQGLLRHGADAGEVRLAFTVEDQQYVIYRSLRRARGTVVQDAGWLEIDGQREPLTPSELRARVFQILGYPLQFLAKQRNLVYRATVYTPQEEMKAVLSQPPEERVETVRRLFGLDAYRAARDNAQLVAKTLKDREAGAQETIARLVIERQAARERLDGAQALIAQAQRLREERTAILARQAIVEQERSRLEEERAQLVARRSAQAMAQRQRTLLEQQSREHERVIGIRRQTILQTQEALQVIARRMDDAAGDGTDVVAWRARQDVARVEIEQARQEEGKLRHIVAECAHGPAIDAGTPCPTCQQIVSASHLEGVRAALNAKGQAAQARLARVHARLAGAQAAADTARVALERLAARAELEERARLLGASITTAREEAQQHETDLARVRADLAGLPPAVTDATLDERSRAITTALEHTIATARSTAETLLGIERSLSRVETEQDALVAHRERALALDAEIAQRTARANADAEVRSWLLQRFSPVTEAIERRVLAAVHGALDATFRSLVAQLLEDGALEARIDATFTPIVVQDGYEMDVAFLSGGERTAVALAYRLALARAVRSLLAHVATAGVVLLDEPTDGFSREQLERVTEVLRGIGAEQLLIVSHEQMLEGFVDRIVRVTREPDGSRIPTRAESL